MGRFGVEVFEVGSAPKYNVQEACRHPRRSRMVIKNSVVNPEAVAEAG